MQAVKSIVLTFFLFCLMAFTVPFSAGKQASLFENTTEKIYADMDDMLSAINNTIARSSTLERKYKFNATRYGYLWCGANTAFDLQNLPQQKSYSNKVYDSRGISVYKMSAGGYMVYIYFNKWAKTDYDYLKIATFENESDAKTVYDNLCALRDYTAIHLGNFREYAGYSSTTNLIENAKKYFTSTLEKKANCHSSSVVKKGSFYVSNNKAVYYDLVFNQPASTIEYGASYLEDFRGFLKQYEFSLADLEGIAVDPQNTFRTEDVTYTRQCEVGLMTLRLKSNSVFLKSRTRYDDKWAKAMGRNIDDSEKYTDVVEIHFDNSDRSNGRRMAEYIQLASLVEKNK